MCINIHQDVREGTATVEKKEQDTTIKGTF